MKLKSLSYYSVLFLTVSTLTACQSFVGCQHNDSSCFKPHRSQQQQSTQLNPNFNYIRMTLNGQVAWLAQGATDITENAPEAVFYSADRNVFKWSQGRLSAVEHSAFSWREQKLPVLDWQNIRQQKTQFSRQLDLVDGTLSLQEQREIQPSHAPRFHSFVGDANTLQWVRETTIHPTTQTYFDSWYAFQSDSVEPIYGQQCISAQHCISWQKWNK